MLPFDDEYIPFDLQADSVCEICYWDDFQHAITCPRFDQTPQGYRYSDADEMEDALDDLMDCE